MDLKCLEMGTNCEQVVSGVTTDELISAVHGHMKLAHGRTDAELADPELDEVIRGAIWQSSRPPNIRTPHPEI
jgi:predicted small metal-binding protein